MKKTVLKGAAMLLGGVLLGTLLMIAAYAIPTESVWENVRESAQTLEREGLRYEVIDGYHASRLDNFTDAIMLGNAVLTTENPVESAMTARHFAGGETVGTLMRYLDGEDMPTESYARYWHGYLVMLKPLLLVMNLNSIRVLNMYAQLVLVLLAVLTVCVFMRMRSRRKPNRERRLSLLFCALLPIGWYMALLNHSAEHAFFTYRALCVTVFAGLSLLLPAGKAET